MSELGRTFQTQATQTIQAPSASHAVGETLPTSSLEELERESVEVRILVDYSRKTWGAWRRFAVWRKPRLSKAFPEDLIGYMDPAVYSERINKIHACIDRQQYARWMAFTAEIIDYIGAITIVAFTVGDVEEAVPYTRIMIILMLAFHVVTMNVVRLQRIKAQAKYDEMAKEWSSSTVKYEFEPRGLWLGHRMLLTIVVTHRSQTFDPDPETLPPPPPIYTQEEVPPPSYSLHVGAGEGLPDTVSLPPPKRFSVPVITIHSSTDTNTRHETTTNTGRETPLLADSSSVYELFGGRNRTVTSTDTDSSSVHEMIGVRIDPIEDQQEETTNTSDIAYDSLTPLILHKHNDKG